MIVQRLIFAAFFALPLAACEREAEVGYEEGVYEEGVATENSAQADEPVVIDEDLRGEVMVDEDLVEDRSAGVYKGGDAEMGD